jgi:hypothetical protein
MSIVRVLARALVLGFVAALLALPVRADSFDPAQMPTLWIGASGPAVSTLQSALNEWRGRHGAGEIGVDASFGPQTRSAVVSFQWGNGLYPDGVVGPLTWKALAALTTGGTSGGSTGTPGQSAESAREEAAWRQFGMPGSYSVRDGASNSGRPVAVYLPAGFDPAYSARVLIYFHGHGGNVGTAFAQNGVLARLRDLGERHPQTVFICPQAAAAPFSYWMNAASGESFAGLERESLAEAKRLAGGGTDIDVEDRIVSAHSGGGLALRNAVTSGQFEADEIEFLDCTYGDWGEVVVRWALSLPAASQPTIEAWHTPGSTAANDAVIAAMAPALVTVHVSPVVHGAIPGRFLGTALDR